MDELDQQIADLERQLAELKQRRTEKQQAAPASAPNLRAFAGPAYCRYVALFGWTVLRSDAS